jgi:hypothetical protein
MKQLLLVAAVAVALLLAAGSRKTGDAGSQITVVDTDGDGCADIEEFSLDQQHGGKRDPNNPWDFFDPEKLNTPRRQTVADILRVLGQYGKNDYDSTPGEPPYANPGYTPDTDRTALIGGNVWNLGPPDGQQTVTDILASVKQYNHNCAGPRTIDAATQCGSIVKELGEPEDPVQLSDGQSHTECFLVRRPDTGGIVDVLQFQTTNDGTAGEGTAMMDLPPPPGAAPGTASSSQPVTLYRCDAERVIRSPILAGFDWVLHFTDLADDLPYAYVRLHEHWYGVTDQSNPWYGFVGHRYATKDVGALSPYGVTNRNDTYETQWLDPWNLFLYEEYTYSSFRWEVGVHLLIVNFSVTKDFDMQVWSKQWVDQGQGWCSQRTS